MHRALWEFRVRGVVTNLRFLDQLITHPRFENADYTTRFIDDTPELFHFPRKRDRATRLLRFVADVIVNGNPEVIGRARPTRTLDPRPPKVSLRRVAAARHEAATRRAGPPEVRAVDAGAAAGAPHRHDVPRRPPVAARHAVPNSRPGGRGAGLRAPRTEPLLGRVLGRGDLRRRHALPQGVPLGPPGRVPRGDAEPAAADAAALRERGRLHELPRQRRALLRRAGGEERRGPLPRVRLAQLGREHARRDGRGARDRPPLRGGDLLHGQSQRPSPDEVRPQVLRRDGARSWKRPARTFSASRTWRVSASRVRPTRW